MIKPTLFIYAVVLLLALSLVYTRVTTRSLYLQLQAEQQFRDDFNVEWGRLLLQEARHAEPRYIEKVARQKLGMVFPVRENISVIRLP